MCPLSRKNAVASRSGIVHDKTTRIIHMEETSHVEKEKEVVEVIEAVIETVEEPSEGRSAEH